jgi:addiction module HigA family antidote
MAEVKWTCLFVALAGIALRSSGWLIAIADRCSILICLCGSILPQDTFLDNHDKPTKNPPHPGEIIRDLDIEPLELTVMQAAAGLGVSRKTLSLLLNGHAGISPETPMPARSAGLAVHLSKAMTA